jgi:hypothetical protein
MLQRFLLTICYYRKNINNFNAMYSTSPRQELLEAISQLSDRQIETVLQFIQTVQTKKAITQEISDPLIDFVGANTHGNLAQNIDNSLYE